MICVDGEYLFDHDDVLRYVRQKCGDDVYLWLIKHEKSVRDEYAPLEMEAEAMEHEIDGWMRAGHDVGEAIEGLLEWIYSQRRINREELHEEVRRLLKFSHSELNW